MSITNTYHGCDVVSDLDAGTFTVHKGGECIGTGSTLAEAVAIAKKSKLGSASRAAKAPSVVPEPTSASKRKQTKPRNTTTEKPEA